MPFSRTHLRYLTDFLQCIAAYFVQKFGFVAFTIFYITCALVHNTKVCSAIRRFLYSLLYFLKVVSKKKGLFYVLKKQLQMFLIMFYRIQAQ